MSCDTPYTTAVAVAAMDIAYIIIRHPASHDSTSATAQRNIAAFAFNPGRCFQREQGESSLATDVIIAALGETLEKRAMQSP